MIYIYHIYSMYEPYGHPVRLGQHFVQKAIDVLSELVRVPMVEVQEPTRSCSFYLHISHFTQNANMLLSR